MRKGSLFIRIYLGCVLALQVSSVAAVLLVNGGRLGVSPDMKHLSKMATVFLTLRRHDLPALQAEFDWIKQYPVRASLYDPGGHLLGSSVSPPLPMVPAKVVEQLRAADEIESTRTRFVYAGRENGQLVSIGLFDWDGFGLARVAKRIIGLFLGLLVFAAVFARYLTQPLQHLANTARRFGRGELGARARLIRNDEIGEVGRAFDEMADRIMLLMASQQELMANVYHELQTPIARIHVALEHITLKGLDKAKALLPEIEIDLAEFQRLFDDVMMVARLDLARNQEHTARAPLRIEAVSLESLLQRTATRFRSECQTHTLVLTVQPELPELQADRVLLRRVIENLIENARKYSEPGSLICVSAAAGPPGVIMEVADQGMGIDAADLKQVFTPFFRSDRSRSRQTGGVGLGLALARRVVEAHDGTIEIKSTLGVGTSVIVKLPA